VSKLSVTHTFIIRPRACVHVVRKQRVETYLHPDTVAQLENNIDVSMSEFIRDATTEKLDKVVNDAV